MPPPSKPKLGRSDSSVARAATIQLPAEKEERMRALFDFIKEQVSDDEQFGAGQDEISLADMRLFFARAFGHGEHGSDQGSLSFQNKVGGFTAELADLGLGAAMFHVPGKLEAVFDEMDVNGDHGVEYNEFRDVVVRAYERNLLRVERQRQRAAKLIGTLGGGAGGSMPYADFCRALEGALADGAAAAPQLERQLRKYFVHRAADAFVGAARRPGGVDGVFGVAGVGVHTTITADDVVAGFAAFEEANTSVLGTVLRSPATWLGVGAALVAIGAIVFVRSQKH